MQQTQQQCWSHKKEFPPVEQKKKKLTLQILLKLEFDLYILGHSKCVWNAQHNFIYVIEFSTLQCNLIIIITFMHWNNSECKM